MKKTYTCKDATYDSTREDDLSLWEKVKWRWHLLICPPCDFYARRMQDLRSLLKKSIREKAEGAVPEEMEELKKEVLSKLKSKK